jgi:hypothetical protein
MLVPFFKFFLAPKNDFFPPSKTCDHYALINTSLLHKLILLYFEMTLHKTRKIFEKMDKNRCPKMRSTKHFWENSTRARRFAELFGTHARDTIHGLAISKTKLGKKSTSKKMHDWMMRQSPKRANVFSRKRFSHFWDMRQFVDNMMIWLNSC